MRSILTLLADIIFPPTDEELELRGFSPETFLQSVRKAPSAAFPYIFPLFAYKEPVVAELIWQIKNKKNRHAIEIGAFALHKKLKEKMQENPRQKIMLIPIPISKKRHRERGYNQCELLIDGIMKLEGEKGKEKSKNNFEKGFDILSRPKHAATKQAFKNRSERLQSVGSIFIAKPIPELFDQKLVIIDDVVTTGSTVKEARDTLLAGGYRDVEVLALAH